MVVLTNSESLWFCEAGVPITQEQNSVVLESSRSGGQGRGGDSILISVCRNLRYKKVFQ